jgi:TetR/AcrR family transcriptional regulator, transcriptional repressor for nem operon
MALVIKYVKHECKTEAHRMRVTKEKAAHHREEILISAARLFREAGIGPTGIDSIAQDAGLTHGGLYSQFRSKQEIVAEAVRFALAKSKRVWQRTAQGQPGSKAFADIVSYYLSRAHRDGVGRGCLIAALSCDISREPAAVREAFTSGLRDALEILAGLMPDDTRARREGEAIAAFACMVGALILGRAVNDEALSRRILKSAVRRLERDAIERRPSRRRLKANVRTSP